MKSTKLLITIIYVSIFFCTPLLSQIDSTSHNGIWEIGVSHRFSSKPSNELGTDRSGIQYTLDIGYEWNINPKNKLGFIISSQYLSAHSDAYIAPMFTWNFIPYQDWNHKLAIGPILHKGHNDVDFINGYSLSYDITLTNKLSISNRFDLLYDTRTSPIYSYSPGIELKGNYGKVVIIAGAVVTTIGAVILLSQLSNSI